MAILHATAAHSSGPLEVVAGDSADEIRRGIISGRTGLRRSVATAVTGALTIALVITAPMAASAQAASTAAAPAPAVSSHAPAGAKPRGDVRPFALCDPSGDRRAGDDCIRTKLTKRASDGKVVEDDVISARISIHESLFGRSLVSDVQARRLEDSGVKSRWHTIRTMMWEASTTKSTTVRDINVCTAAPQGRYELRTRTKINGPMTRSGTSTVATSATSSLTVSGNSSSCLTSPNDEAIVDYYNIMKVRNLISVNVHDTGAEFDITISCAKATTGAAPSTMSVALFTHDQTANTTCADQTPIVFTKSTLSSNAS